MDLLALYIFMLIVFYGYVGTITALYGILPSVSESFYRLPKKWNWIFTIVLWAFALPCIIIGVPTTGLMFLSGAGIMFVGAAAAFKQELTKTVHIIGATVGMVASQIAIAFIYKYWEIALVSCVLAGLLFFFRKKINNKHVFWIEMIAFTAIALTYGLFYL